MHTGFPRIKARGTYLKLGLQGGAVIEGGTCLKILKR